MRTGQNTSPAVMQQRHEARDALEDFPTCPWATRALCEFLKYQGHDLALSTVSEPCANRGYMVAALLDYFGAVQAADVHDYGAGFEVSDYLFGPLPDPIDWTITNPPFRLAEQFIARALEASTDGVAMFVRSAFLEGQGRYERLFSKNPPTYVLQFVERVMMFKGIVRESGSKYWDPNADNGPDLPKGKEKTASGATAFSWLVWDKSVPPHAESMDFRLIPPSRLKLERPGDYAPRGDLIV